MRSARGLLVRPAPRATDSNQPLATIDVGALKSTRFLLERPGRRPALPYRDAEGKAVFIIDGTEAEGPKDLKFLFPEALGMHFSDSCKTHSF